MTITQTRSVSYFVKSLPFLALWVASLLLFGMPFYSDGVFFGDNHASYPLFRDYLQSLNHFGEFVQWLPQYQNGWPGVYYILYGYHGLTPIMVVLGTAAYLLGICGVHITSFYSLYFLHFGILVSLVFLIPSVLIALRFFRGQYWVLLYVFSLLCFSQSYIINLGNIGSVERLGYSLFLLYMLLCAENLNAKRWWPLFIFAFICNVLSLNYYSPLMLVLFLPVSLSIIAVSKSLRTSLRAQIAQARPIHMLILIAGTVMTLAPFVAVNQVKDGLEVKRGTSTGYTLKEFAPGNPMEILNSGVPYAGMIWQPLYRDDFNEVGLFKWLCSFNYNGLMMIPFSIFALIFARSRAIIFVLFLNMIFLMFAFALGHDSSIFRFIHGLNTPINFFNHFNDLTWNGGAYLFAVAMAATGLATFLANAAKPLYRLSLFVISLVFGGYSLYKSLTLNQGEAEIYFLLPLQAAILLSISSAIFFASRRIQVRTAASIIVLLSFTDVLSNVLVYYSEVIINKLSYDKVVEMTAPSGVGLTLPNNHDYYIPEHIMGVKSNARKEAGLEAKPALTVKGKNISIENESISSINVSKYTFNSLHFDVKAGEDNLLAVIKDAYFKYWNVQVNDVRADLIRTSEGFKALKLASGISRVELNFNIPYLSIGLRAAHFTFWCIFLYCLLTIWKVRPTSEP
ncbi:MAG: hypothetical protein AB7G93_07410 [Bdellovibrionales bacterium]